MVTHRNQVPIFTRFHGHFIMLLPLLENKCTHMDSIHMQTKRIFKRRTLFPAERQHFIKQAGGVCIYCYRLYNPALAKHFPHQFFASWEIDHIVPLANGGNNTNSNLHAICKQCNQLKSNMNYFDFIAKKNRRK